MTLSPSLEDENCLYIKLPGSKSIINRVLIIASILKKNITISPGSQCNDVNEMLQALKPLGLSYSYSNNEALDSDLQIQWSKYHCNKNKIKINEAGSVFRFILSRYAFEDNFELEIEIGEQLAKRPYLELVNCLIDLGADLKIIENKIFIIGKKLSAKKIAVKGNVSSQFISSLLLSASLLKNPLELEITGEIYSKSYIEMTLSLLKNLGVANSFEHSIINISNNPPIIKKNLFACEADYSTAFYFWIYGLLLKKQVFIQLNNKKNLQGDLNFLNILLQMGITPVEKLFMNNKYLALKTEQSLKGINVSMKDMPDQVMSLAFLALFADNTTIISNIEHLKYKESNRINNLISEFQKINANLIYKKEKLHISPLKYQFPSHSKELITLNSHHDHRLAMIYKIMEKIFPNTKLDNINCIKKSAPEFISILDKISYAPLDKNILNSSQKISKKD